MSEGSVRPLILVFDVENPGTVKLLQGQDALKQFGQQTDQSKARVDIFDRTLGRLNGTLGRMRSMMFSVTTLFGVFVGGLGLAQGIRAVASFEQGMATVQAVSGATADELARVRERARELGATTEFTAGQAAEAFVAMGRAGLTASQQLAAINATLDLATAGALELGQATEITVGVLAGFRLEAGEAGRVADVLAKTANSAKTTVGDLGWAMSFAAPVAATLGRSLEETAAAMGVLGNNSIEGGRAGRSFRSVISSLTQPTDDAKRALDRLGLSVDELNPASNSLADIFQRLRDAGLDASSAISIFGQEGMSTALILAGQADRLRELTGELEAAEGAAEKTARAIRENLSGDLKAMASAFESVILAIAGAPGEGKALDGLTQILQRLTNSLRDLSQSDGLSKFASGIKGASDAVLTLSGYWDEFLMLVRLWLSYKVAGSLLAATDAMVAFAVAVRAGTVSWAGFNAVVRASVIGLVIWGAVEAIIAMKKHTDEVTVFFIDAIANWNSAMEGVKAAFKIVGAALVFSWKATGANLTFIWGAFVAVILGGLDVIGSRFDRVLAQIKNKAAELPEGLKSLIGLEDLEPIEVPVALTLDDTIGKRLDEAKDKYVAAVKDLRAELDGETAAIRDAMDEEIRRIDAAASGAIADLRRQRLEEERAARAAREAAEAAGTVGSLAEEMEGAARAARDFDSALASAVARLSRFQTDLRLEEEIDKRRQRLRESVSLHGQTFDPLSEESAIARQHQRMLELLTVERDRLAEELKIAESVSEQERDLGRVLELQTDIRNVTQQINAVPILESLDREVLMQERKLEIMREQERVARQTSMVIGSAVSQAVFAAEGPLAPATRGFGGAFVENFAFQQGHSPLGQMREMLEERLELQRTYGELTLEQQRELQAAEQALAHVHAAQMLSVYGMMFGGIQQSMANFMRATGSESEALLNIQKGIAVAQAIMQAHMTYSAILAASAIGGIFMGPGALPFAETMARTALLLGYANAGIIAATPTRMHDGGPVTVTQRDRLGPDEVNRVLQTGEGVLSRKGMRALEKLNEGQDPRGQQQQPIVLELDIYNLLSEDSIVGVMQGEKGRSSIVNTISADANAGGPTRHTIRSHR